MIQMFLRINDKTRTETKEKIFYQRSFSFTFENLRFESIDFFVEEFDEISISIDFFERVKVLLRVPSRCSREKMKKNSSSSS